jgi:hypothetical protein
MMQGLCKVRKCYMVFNFVSHKPTFSMTVIRLQGIIVCFQPVEIQYFLAATTFERLQRGANGCATMADDTEHSFLSTENRKSRPVIRQTLRFCGALRGKVV